MFRHTSNIEHRAIEHRTLTNETDSSGEWTSKRMNKQARRYKNYILYISIEIMICAINIRVSCTSIGSSNSGGCIVKMGFCVFYPESWLSTANSLSTGWHLCVGSINEYELECSMFVHVHDVMRQEPVLIFFMAWYGCPFEAITNQ